MIRFVATWIGIGAICLVILVVPISTGARDLAAESGDSWLTFAMPEGSGGGDIRTNDKDCLGYFETRAQAQRFFLDHGGPKRDPHGLDSDHDGVACENYDY